MIFDAQNSFNTVSDNVLTAQDETTVDTHDSDNVIDLGFGPRNFLQNMYFVFQIDTAIVSAGGGTLQIDLVASAAAALTTVTVLWSSGIVANATIVAWTDDTTIYIVKMPAEVDKRYLGVQYTIATDVFSAGSWRAFLADTPMMQVPKGATTNQ